jgi:hypothetical protein
MGCGWIGSHHGGARMTCGDCSSSYNFHPGLSNDGHKIFEHVRMRKSNISFEDKQKNANSIKKIKEENEKMREKEQLLKKQREDYAMAESQKVWCAQSKQMEYERESKYSQKLKSYNESIRQIDDICNKVTKNPDCIMNGIGKELVTGYVFEFDRNNCISVAYRSVFLKPIIVYTLCCGTRVTKQKYLHKFLKKDIKDKLKSSNLPTLYTRQMFIDKIYSSTRDDEYKTKYVNYGSSGDIIKNLLVYKDGRYGFVYLRE